MKARCDVLWCDSARCPVRLTGTGLHRSKPLTVTSSAGGRLVLTMTQPERGEPVVEVHMAVKLTARNIAGWREQTQRLTAGLLNATTRAMTPAPVRSQP